MPSRVNSVRTSFFGKGAVSLLVPELKKMDLQRALIVTDGFLYKSGAADYVGKALTEAGLSYAVYYQVQPNPTVDVINDCITAAAADRSAGRRWRRQRDRYREGGQHCHGQRRQSRGL